MTINLPINPQPNDVFVHEGGQRYIFDGIKWVFKPGGNQVSAHIGGTPPDNPETGDFWWDNVSGKLYVYYGDESAGQWTEAIPSSMHYPPLPAVSGKYLSFDGNSIRWVNMISPEITAPTLTVSGTVVNENNGLSAGHKVEIDSSAFTAVNEDTHTATDWKIIDNTTNEIVYSMFDNPAYITKLVIPEYTLYTGSFTAYARHYGSTHQCGDYGNVAFNISSVASGGTITDSEGFRIHQFNESGMFSITEGSIKVKVVVVAGGGGGGGSVAGGGGGAGGLLQSEYTLSPGNYPVIIGAGGSGGYGHGSGNEGGKTGNDSLFSELIRAYGGGGGGSWTTYALDGGSGGGCNYRVTPAGLGTKGQGTDGGLVVTNMSIDPAGGGGGALLPGEGETEDGIAGNGGEGKQIFITAAVSPILAGGGGGGVYGSDGTPGNGGAGGGGSGTSTSVKAEDGQPNTGGGGGGAGYDGNSNDLLGGNGGSGTVLIWYRYTDNS